MKIDAKVRLALTFFLVPFALLLVLFLVPSVVIPRFHDGQLARLQSDLGALSPPSGSTLLARHGEIGNFGNGDHIDFWAIELRPSGSRAAVQKAYAPLHVPVPNAEDDEFQDVKGGTQPVEIQFLPSPLPANYRVQVGNSDSWNLSRFAGRRGLFTVGVVNSGENDQFGTLFDWRSL